MLKIVYLFSLLLVCVCAQQRFQNQDPDKCVINPNLTLNVGDRVSDPNGLCQEYVCSSTDYVVYGCPVYSNCITEDGDPKALYPDCCTQLKLNTKQGPDCTGVA